MLEQFEKRFSMCFLVVEWVIIPMIKLGFDRLFGAEDLWASIREDQVMRKNMLFAMLVIMACCMGQDCDPDTDGDGVVDRLDGCPNTPICATVDASGCPSDGDGDGVYNGCDECPETQADTIVWGVNGCDADVDGAVPSACIGPDPRAKTIEYSLVNRTSDTTADILIKGTVDNVGTENYTSGVGQQSIELWEDTTKVAEQAFQNLAVGAEVTVEYPRSWNISGQEFPPDHYKLIISYDPDIRDDGVTTNDDCRLTNNSIIRSTAGIATLFE